MADFYADQNISLDLIALLRGRGHTAFTARDLGLERARDDEHLLVAAEHGRMLLTYNRGCSTMRGAAGPGRGR